MPANSRLRMLGESVQYSRGLTGVGGIELEIVEPTVEKKSVKRVSDKRVIRG